MPQKVHVGVAQGGAVFALRSAGTTTQDVPPAPAVLYKDCLLE